MLNPMVTVITESRSYAMPFPLGHTAIGLTAYELNGQKAAPSQRVWGFLFIAGLSNLPDLDMLAGLLAAGNGSLFHRGPTHSLLFALIMGYLAAKAAKRIPALPPFSVGLCSALILSHVLADMVFTRSPVSLFWPFEVNFTSGTSSLGDVFHGIFFNSIGDIGIFLGCVAIIAVVRWLRLSETGRRILGRTFLMQ